jgi:DNA replication protein DnaC
MVTLDGWSRWKDRIPCFSPTAEAPEAPASDRKALHEAAEEARLASHLEACGVPRRDVELLVGGGLRETPAVVGVRDWLRGNKTFCLLVGHFGAGKTVAASAVLRMARRSVAFWDDASEQPVASWSYSKAEGLFVRAAELSNTSPYAEEGRGHWARVRRVTWLVVDDLGMERMDSAGIWQEQFDLLMDCRYSERRRTVLSTNLDSAAFSARYLGRVMDRVQHDGAVVLCGSESLRV